MTESLKVVPIGIPNLADIPAMLEHTAARMRSGEVEMPEQATLVVLVGEPGFRHVEVFDFGGGDATMLTTLGLLEAGKHRLLQAASGG